MFWGLWPDWTYLVLVVPALLLAMLAQANVSSTFGRYARVSSRGLTGAQAARAILDACGLYQVRVERVRGHLTDHFDPRANVVRLSDSVFDSASVAAVGVAAHETGHAVQYAERYFPMRVRGAVLPAANLGSQLSIPLVLLGFFLGMQPLVNVGILLFAGIAVFQLVTLPVEFNASRRALAVIGARGMLGEQERQGARRVLAAAAMTYVAALLVSVMQLLRLVLRFGGRRGDD